MEANEFVGFTLPVVNEGPWSYFSNGGNSNGGNDGEDETMIVNGSIIDGVISIDETSKTIYDAIASGKIVIVKTVDDSLGTIYSLITESDFTNDTYTFVFTIATQRAVVSGTANENPSTDDGGSDDNNGGD